ncbi:MAG: DUF3334 family protein [Nitrospinota bacterium]
MRSLKNLPPKQKTAMTIAKLFAESYVDIFTKMKLNFSVSPSMHFIEVSQTSQRVSSILDFTGSINGFMIVNYPEDAALDTVKQYQMTMGLSEEDCPTSIGTEVQDTLGELLNQASGAFRRNLEVKYDIKTKSFTPITMIVNNMLVVRPAETGTKYSFIRAQLNTPAGHSFFIEFCIQDIIFVLTEEIAEDSRSTDERLDAARLDVSDAGAAGPAATSEKPSVEPDTDDLLKNLFG